MKKIKREVMDIPTTLELKMELNKEKYKFRYKSLLKSTIYVLVVVVAVSVLIATLVFPVLRINGSSMEPTLVSDDIVLCINKTNFSSGDIVAFYYNNKILVKRIIAVSTDWVDIDEFGNVFINDELIEEVYIKGKDRGNSDIKFPYQVPENSYFVLGDQRDSSIDSRNSLIGAVSSDNIIGKVIFRVWPLKRVSIIK